MGPKPFPFPIGVGVDICRVNRVANLLQKENIRNLWARKVFTRLEWPGLCRRLQRANRSEDESARQSERERDNTMVPENLGDNVWMLPKLSKHLEVLSDPEAYWLTVADQRSRLAILTRHLAGRWAAKEAVIKAHRHRQIYMQDVSIVHLPRQISKDNKVVALIDPVCNTVELDERVAELRGLRGFRPQSRQFHKGELLNEGEHDESAQVPQKQSSHFNRRRKIQESDRQIAEINISHDGDYAVAVCMAFDSSNIHPEGRRIVDDGSGPPMHEPQWGDEGWFEQDGIIPNDEDWKNMSLDDLLDEPKPSMDTEAYGKAFKKALEDAESHEDWKIPPLP